MPPLFRTSLLAFAAIAACGCGESAPPAAAGCRAFDALVATSDYASSGVGGVALDGANELSFGADLGRDPQLAVSEGRAFFIARDRDLVFELDASCGAPRKRLSTADATHAGTTNPQDVAVAPDGTLWIPRFNQPSLLVLAPDGATSHAIDLAHTPLADPDGNPNAGAVRIVDVGGEAKAFVTLERLDDGDRLRSKQASTMLRIDVATLAVEEERELVGRNPFNRMVESGGLFYLAMPRNFDAIEGDAAGIERFDPISGTSSLFVREEDLGGSATTVALAGGCGAAIIADPTPNVNATSLVAFDAASGAITVPLAASPLRTPGFDLAGMTWVGDVLLVGDRRRAANGYPIHRFARGEGCILQAIPDTIFVSQKPLALRVPRAD